MNVILLPSAVDLMVSTWPKRDQSDWRGRLMSHAWRRRFLFCLLHKPPLPLGAIFSLSGVQAQLEHRSMSTKWGVILSTLHSCLTMSSRLGYSIGHLGKGGFLNFPGCWGEMVISHIMALREFLCISLWQLNLMLVPSAVSGIACICIRLARQKKKKLPDSAKWQTMQFWLPGDTFSCNDVLFVSTWAA